MEEFGSLGDFLQNCPKLAQSRPATTINQDHSAFLQYLTKEKLSARIDLNSRQYGIFQSDRRPSGFIYQTPSRGQIRPIYSAVPKSNIPHLKSKKSIKRPQTSIPRQYSQFKSTSPPSARPYSKLSNKKNEKNQVKEFKLVKQENITVSLQEQVRNEVL